MRKLATAWARDGRFGLAALLLAAFAFDLLRALTVPPGLWNIDEVYHFTDVLNAARFLPYEVGHLFGAPAAPPQPLDGGSIIDPNLIFHPPGWLPLRGVSYYLLQALPQLFLDSAPDSVRLLVARLVSVGLHLLIIALDYSMAVRLLPAGVGRWVPLTAAGLAAFVPSYSDMMSAVNPDAAAAAAGTLYLWAWVGLLRQGAHPRQWALLAVSTVLGITTKETFWPLLPATGLTLLWLVLGWRARLATLGAGVALAAGLALWLQPLTPGGAAYWFDADWEFGHDASLAPRVQTDTPVGSFALETGGKAQNGIWQFVPEARLAAVRQGPVTWGVWLRATPPVEVTVGLRSGADWLDQRTLLASPDWRFYAFADPLAGSLDHLALYLGSPEDEGLVQYDGTIIAPGEFPGDAPPAFASPDATRGEWGGQPFANLLLNPSGEASWPQIKDAYNVRPRNFNTRLNSVLAWRRTLPAFVGLGRWLLANFWSEFGGLLPGLSSLQLIPFALATAWAGLGAATVLLRDLPRGLGLGRERTSRLALWTLAAAALATWLVVLYRSDFVPSTANVVVWSVSRHASAGLAATASLLALGLLRWCPARARPWAVAALLFLLFAVNVWIVLGVQIPFYHCPSSLPTDCLPTVH
jgi:hypothetical protein